MHANVFLSLWLHMKSAMAVLNVAPLYPDCIIKTTGAWALCLKFVMPSGLEY